MVEVIKHIIKSLVEDESSVRFEESVNGDDVTVSVYVKESDMGRVIGKKGDTVNAIRKILMSGNSRDGKRYFIQIGDKRRV